ncbi:unnamed protein product [Rotaria sp. Silwood1]|nr:unnamed protein product [Rotaria sp. Silwood1]
MFIFPLFGRHFVRTDIKSHFYVPHIVDQIFHIVSPCSLITTTVTEDHLVSDGSSLFTSLELFICTLLSYFSK